MKPLVSTFAIALFVCASTAAAAQPAARPKSSAPTALDATSQAKVRRIVEGREFQIAARSRNIAQMNDLLKSTGAVAANPVAIFFCRLPAVPVYRNGQWYCEGGGISLKVEPYMYMD
ncbi:MAG TPA: hypothetical protein VGB04_05210 [Allosphingosinicella sp.]|jgi:hypothetical protein